MKTNFSPIVMAEFIADNHWKLCESTTRETTTTNGILHTGDDTYLTPAGNLVRVTYSRLDDSPTEVYINPLTSYIAA